MNEMKLPIPNPEDWVDATEAAAIVGRSPAAITDMGHRKVLTPYRISGRKIVYWRADVLRVAQALRLVGARR